MSDNVRDNFRRMLRGEKDVDYLRALLVLAKTWARGWVIDDINNEIELRRQNAG